MVFAANATPPGAGVIIRDNRRRDCDCIFNLGNKRAPDWRSGSLCRRRLGFFFTESRRQFDRFEPFPEAGFDKVGIGGNQRVLDRKVTAATEAALPVASMRTISSLASFFAKASRR
jgi:hypothetical protein